MADTLMENILNQENCVLFTKLPAEVRYRVFELVLSACDDYDAPYREDRVYYRPGYHFRQKLHLELLRTCKAIYQEARLLPVATNEHTFWLFGGPWAQFGKTNKNTANWNGWYGSLNPEQKSSVGYIHIFAQQYLLEDLAQRADSLLFRFSTTKLRLTFRNSDWWSCESPPESSDRLGICPWLSGRVDCRQMAAQPVEPTTSYIRGRMTKEVWGWLVCQVERLEILEMEFETDMDKSEQLDKVVERAKYWKFPKIESDYVLEWTGKLEESSWQSMRLLKPDYLSLRRSTVPQRGPERRLRVVTMTWKAIKAGNEVIV